MEVSELQLDKPFYAVAVYDQWQEYGGPEEGGWYYHAGELVGVSAWYSNEDVAYEHARMLNANFAPERSRYGDGPTAEVVELPRRRYPEGWCHNYGDIDEESLPLVWDIPAYYPEERPHYC